MKIIKINEGEKKIGLSIKAVKQDEYQKDLESYREQQADRAPRATAMGEAFRAAQAGDRAGGAGRVERTAFAAGERVAPDSSER